MAFAAAVAAGYKDLRALSPPVRMRGEVVRGFGRGSKSLGIPTANLAAEAPGVAPALEGLPAGVYFGWASVRASIPAKTAADAPANVPANAPTDAPASAALPSSLFSPLEAAAAAAIAPAPATSSSSAAAGAAVYKMVMSVGWNPFFKNERKTVEPHLLHDFRGADFYGEELRLVLCGYMRPERNYASLEALVAAINADIEHSRALLGEPPFAALEADGSLAPGSAAPAAGGAAPAAASAAGGSGADGGAFGTDGVGGRAGAAQ